MHNSLWLHGLWPAGFSVHEISQTRILVLGVAVNICVQLLHVCPTEWEINVPYFGIPFACLLHDPRVWDLQMSSLNYLRMCRTKCAKMCVQLSKPVRLWHSHSMLSFTACCRSSGEQYENDVCWEWSSVPVSPSSLMCIPRNSNAQLFWEPRPRSGKL